jgi:PKD repeat protein
MRSLTPPLRTSILGIALAAAAASVALAQVPAFTVDTANPKAGTPVHFHDASTGSPIAWMWRFGDPASGSANSSMEQNPVHTFSHSGVFPVTLQVTGGGGPLTQPVSVEPAAAGTGCQQGAGFLCLNGGRFQVNANWTKSDGTSGAGTAVSLTDDSGYFWFFNDANIEMVVKVLSGCGINNAYWVFAAGLTNVQVNWQVVDTQNQITYTQTNPQTVPFAPVQATDAFPSSCP